MGSKAVIPFLVGMMLVTGVANTILTKYQDNQCVRNCHAKHPKDRKNFEQPVWQTVQMFIGEMGCWLVVAGASIYNRLRATQKAGYEPVSAQSRAVDGSEDAAVDNPDAADEADVEPVLKPLVSSTGESQRPLQGWRVILLAIPATCDILATTSMNVGLILVAASIYQMTRGALVLFVGLFSVLFLRSRLALYKWTALFIVVAGVAIVGLAGAIQSKHNTKPHVPGHDNPPPLSNDLFLANRETTAPDMDPVVKTVLGILLIFCAQIFTAAQFVVEESILHRFSITPLACVGWEGTFGLIITLLGMLILHVAYGRTDAGHGGYFDATQGWREMTTNASIGVTSLLIMVSIGGFNFFGLSVTRTVSATSRSTIDTCRTLFIWVISLGLGWETFKWLQVLGFAALVYGTFLFNDIVRAPRLGRWLCCGMRSRTRVEADDVFVPDGPIANA